MVGTRPDAYKKKKNFSIKEGGEGGIHDISLTES